MKVYKLTLYGIGGNCIFEDPEDMECDMEMANEEAKINLEPGEYKSFDIPRVIEEIKKLEVGESWEHDLGEVECLEMSQEEFDSLPEFTGW